jgi:hypothetical protein
MDATLDNVGESKVIFSTGGSSPPKDAVYLVSGSWSFVNNWPQRVLNPMLVLCDENIRSKWKVLKSHLMWSCLLHETIGGVTQFEAVLGTNILDFEWMKTNLQRTWIMGSNHGGPLLPR